MYRYATVEDIPILKQNYDIVRQDYIDKHINTMLPITIEELNSLVQKQRIIMPIEPNSQGIYEAVCFTPYENYTQVEWLLGWGTVEVENIKMFITLDLKKPTRYYTTVGSPLADWMINSPYPYRAESCKLVGIVEVDGEIWENYEFNPPEMKFLSIEG